MKKKLTAIILIGMFLTLNFSSIAIARGNEGSIQTEHLEVSKEVAKKSPTNLVMSTNDLMTVIEYNVIEAEFAENFSSKTAKVGDEVPFLLGGGLETQEGTIVLPEGSKIIAEVTDVTKPKSFNRSGKVRMEFKRIEYPDGYTIPFEAQLFAKKNQLSRGKLNALGKGLGTTLGLGAVGVGAGCGIGVAAGAVIIGGFAIGLPVGIAAGALLGLVTPGLHYKAKAGDKLLIQLTDNLEVTK